MNQLVFYHKLINIIILKQNTFSNKIHILRTIVLQYKNLVGGGAAAAECHFPKKS